MTDRSGPLSPSIRVPASVLKIPGPRPREWPGRSARRRPCGRCNARTRKRRSDFVHNTRCVTVLPRVWQTKPAPARAVDSTAPVAHSPGLTSRMRKIKWLALCYASRDARGPSPRSDGLDGTRLRLGLRLGLRLRLGFRFGYIRPRQRRTLVAHAPVNTPPELPLFVQGPD